MKKILFIYILINMLQANGQEMPINGSIYGYITCGGPPTLPSVACKGSKSNPIEYTDTIINDTVYHKFPNGNLNLYLDHKYYIVDSSYAKNKYLLYDFTLQVNDVFYIESIGQNLTVESKCDTTLENGEIRTYIKLVGDGNIFEWIEGIGDVSNDFYYDSYIYYTDVYMSVYCVSDQFGLVYKSSGYDIACDDIDKLTNINSTISNKIKVFPNLVENYVTIFCNEFDIVSYTLYGISGDLLLKGEGKHVNIKNVPKGVYVLEVNCNGSITNYKIIK